MYMVYYYIIMLCVHIINVHYVFILPKKIGIAKS